MKTSPMEEDMVTLETGGAKEDMVHGKGTDQEVDSNTKCYYCGKLRHEENTCYKK